MAQRHARCRTKGSKMALTSCYECSEEMSTAATACPKCGAPKKKKSRTVFKVLGGILAVLFVLGLIGSMADKSPNRSAAPQPQAAAQSESPPVSTGAPAAAPAPAPEPAVAPKGYKHMDLLDLKADINSLAGQRVSVDGSLQMMGEVAMLRSDPMDTTPVWVEIGKLPRDDRKQALKGCLTYCGVQVNGRIGQGTFGLAIIAESVVWK